MAYNVKFLKGTSAAYTALTKDANTFYFTTDDNNLYLGSLKLTNASDLSTAIGRIAQNESDIEAIEDELIILKGDAETDGSIAKMIATAISTARTAITTEIGTAKSEVIGTASDAKTANTVYGAKAYADDAATTAANGKDSAIAAAKKAGDDAQADVDALETAVGDVADLETTATTVVTAINEVNTAVQTATTAGKVTISESTTGLPEGVAKSYTFYQGDSSVESNKIGTINLAKDLVVTAGEVVKDPEGQPAGTYIKLTIANQTAPIFINVKDLVDVYTAATSATEVQVAISDTNVVSATLVDGGVATAKIADSAVTTAKIADKNVTKAKLDDSVQTSLGKADSAVQSIVTGSANGTISVDGSDVAVKGLGSAAYTDSTAYDAAGSAAAVLGQSGDLASASTVFGAKAYADSLAVNYDAAGSAATAESNAKAYTDTALTWGTF